MCACGLGGGRRQCGQNVAVHACPPHPQISLHFGGDQLCSFKMPPFCLPTYATLWGWAVTSAPVIVIPEPRDLCCVVCVLCVRAWKGVCKPWAKGDLLVPSIHVAPELGKGQISLPTSKERGLQTPPLSQKVIKTRSWRREVGGAQQKQPASPPGNCLGREG